MRNITKIFILVLSLILLLAVSCSNDDKTGIKNNPPEDTEIVDGGTGSGSSSGGSSETETGGGTGTGGSSETETGGGTGTGGDSGTETGGGSGSGSGSGEGGSGEVTPPSEPEILTTEIDAKDFPTELLGRYKDDKLTSSGFSGYNFETEVSTITELGIQKTKIEGSWLKDGTTDATSRQVVTIEKWKQTKKGGNPIKLEGKSSDSGGGKYTIIYDYASGTLSGTYTHPDGTWSFNGKKTS